MVEGCDSSFEVKFIIFYKYAICQGNRYSFPVKYQPYII